MPLRKRKPTSPGRRFQSVSDFAEVTTDKPEKSLLRAKPHTGGRNVHGRLTARNVGGGHKQKYRVIDFKRAKDGIPAKVATIEYDPNRNARIALLHYADGEKRYILAPARIAIGDMLMSGRGAGMSIQLVAKEGDFATLRLPSTEMRRVPIDCRATVGAVGNPEAELVSLGKAGRSRWKGRRPHTRGVAMNPVDHPLGGGEGKSSGGRHPTSPWGKKEGRTRAKHKSSDQLIIRRRR